MDPSISTKALLCSLILSAADFPSPSTALVSTPLSVAYATSVAICVMQQQQLVSRRCNLQTAQQNEAASPLTDPLAILPHRLASNHSCLLTCMAACTMLSGSLVVCS